MKYSVDLIRRFYVVTEVVIEAESEDQASAIALDKFSELETPVPTAIQEWEGFNDITEQVIVKESV
jgi:hypothetical protein